MTESILFGGYAATIVFVASFVCGYIYQEVINGSIDS